MQYIDPETLRTAVEEARGQGLDRDPKRLLAWAWDLLGPRLMMSTAFGKSGMAILHMVKETCPELPVYFLDTGFHFAETLAYFDDLKSRWKLNLIAKKPRVFGVEFTEKFGDKLYETDPDRCCHRNKVEPFRELFGDGGQYQGWIAGVRRDQSSTRAGAESIELMEGNLIKVQPMAFWTKAEVERYLEEHDVPLHPLFAKGYPSIGCEPCTRPATDPNDERSGRWAQKAKTECGLHTFWKKADKAPAGTDDSSASAATT